LEAGHEAYFGLRTTYGPAKTSSDALSRVAWLADTSFVGELATNRSDAAAVTVTAGGKPYLVAWLRTADRAKTGKVMLNGVYAGDINFMPQAFAIKNERVKVSFSD
jgi:hypothetical protein